MQMINGYAYVRNPLSIVAIFAAVAQVGGIVTIRFVSEENQFIFVWFLVIFPVFLVILFFAVLVLKPQAFFGPSDYRDDRSFLTALRPASSEEVLASVEKEIENSVPKFSLRVGEQAADRSEHGASSPADQRSQRGREHMGTADPAYGAAKGTRNSLQDYKEYLSIFQKSEKEAIDWLVAKNGWSEQNIVGPITLVSKKEDNTVIDAAFFSEGELNLIEAKYFKGEISSTYVGKIFSNFVALVERSINSRHLGIERISIYFIIISEYYKNDSKSQREIERAILEVVRRDAAPAISVNLAVYPPAET